MPQIQTVLLTDETFVDQLADIAGVGGFFVGRDQPPQREAAAEQYRRAVKLVQQEVVLGAATVFYR